MENPPKPLKFAPKIALAVCIGMLDDNYKKVAYHLNDKGELRFQLQSNPYQVTFKIKVSDSLSQSYANHRSGTSLLLFFNSFH